MSYATLMVHLDLDQKNDARLSVVGDLAERFAARVIGVAAQAEPVYYTADVNSASFVAEDVGQMEANLAAIKQRLATGRGTISDRAQRSSKAARMAVFDRRSRSLYR